MDDNKPKPEENQSTPQPIFETVSEPSESQPPEAPIDPSTSSGQEPIVPGSEPQPEEVAADVATPEEVLQKPPPPPSSPVPPLSGHSDLLRYAIIGGAVGLFIMIFFFIFSMFFSGGGKKETVTLQYWGLWEEKEVVAPLIAAYETKNPNVKIVYQKMAPQDYREKLIARSQRDQGPDIFRFHNTWLPELKDKDVSLLTPIPSNIMSASEFEKTFYPIHKKDLGINGRYYGIPLMIDGLVMVYNNGLFKKAGIQKAPLTWEEMTEDVPKLSVKDKNGQLINSAIAIGTASNVEHFSDLFGLMLIQNGGDIKKLDQPEAAGALESYRKLAEAPTDFWNETMPNSIAAFIQEKVAMIIVPSWELLTIKSANPDIDLKVAPVPKLPGGTPVSIASYWVEGVSVRSKHQVEAWKFVKFLSEKENMAKMYELQSKSRLFGEPYSRVDLGDTLAQNEYIGPVIAQAKYFVSLPLISRTYDNGLNDGIVKYIENAINATIQGVSYSEALRTASQGIAKLFEQYKI